MNETETGVETNLKAVHRRKLLTALSIANAILRVILVALIICTLFRMLFVVSGGIGKSMFPTINEGDILLIQRALYAPKHGDIISAWVETLDCYCCKRVIGLPGDSIYIDTQAGVVYRNGIALEEPYIGTPTIEDGDMCGEAITVSDGHIFVMGDNRLYSTDSRYAVVGEIPIENVKGKVLMILVHKSG